jgi:hypothetical protein
MEYSTKVYVEMQEYTNVQNAIWEHKDIIYND